MDDNTQGNSPTQKGKEKQSLSSRIAKGIGRGIFATTGAGAVYEAGKLINKRLGTPTQKESSSDLNESTQDNIPMGKGEASVLTEEESNVDQTYQDKTPNSPSKKSRVAKASGKVYMYTSPGAFIVGKLWSRKKEREKAQKQARSIGSKAHKYSIQKSNKPSFLGRSGSALGKFAAMTTGAYWIHKFAAKFFPKATKRFDSFFKRPKKYSPQSVTPIHGSAIDYVGEWNKAVLQKNEAQRKFIKDNLNRFFKSRIWKYGKYAIFPGGALVWDVSKKYQQRKTSREAAKSYMDFYKNPNQEQQKQRNHSQQAPPHKTHSPAKLQRFLKGSGKAIYKYTTPAGQTQTVWNRWIQPRASGWNTKLGRRFGNVPSPNQLGKKAAQKIGSQIGKTVTKQAVLAFFKTPPGWVTLGVIAAIILFFGLMALITTVLSGGGGSFNQVGGGLGGELPQGDQQPQAPTIPGFTLTKSANPTEMRSPGKITYTISYTHTPSSAVELKHITIFDNIPENTDLLPAETTGNYDLDPSGRRIAWALSDPKNQSPLTLAVLVKESANNTTIENFAYATALKPGDGMIDSSSASLNQIFQQSAASAQIPTAMLKAIAKKESGVLSYTDQDVTQFNSPVWFVGRIDNAPTREQNDPLIIKGYGYNTCQYMECFPGADVRGAMQFEINTWNGIKSALVFADGHDPDRRYVRDIIFGAGKFIAQKAMEYDSRYKFSANPNNWTEEQVKALARIYCGGNPDANVENDRACTPAGGSSYDTLVWEYYQEFRAIDAE